MVKKAKAHQLYKQFGALLVQNVNFSAGTSDIVRTGGYGQEWENLNPAGQLQTWVNRQYIDLAGWTREDLTLFTQAVDIQNGFQPLLSSGITNLFYHDYITTRRMTDEECQAIGGDRPAFLTSSLDLMQCIYGEWHTWSNSSEVGTAVNTARDTFGSGNATAMDKLHITRVVCAFGAGTAEGFSVYDANYVIGAVTKEEKDLVHMERLRRSYVTQGEL